jgi:hypothetical protein
MRRAIVLIFILAKALSAQSADRYTFKLTLYSMDKTQQKILTKSCGTDENFEGYFADTHMFDFIPFGKIKKGGFSLIDKDVFGGIADIQRNEWLKNNFTDMGLSSLVLPPEFTTALSFQISAAPVINNKDSIHLFIKYAVFETKAKTTIMKPDFDVNIKLNYKHFVIPLNMEIPLTVFNELFKGYKFSLETGGSAEEYRLVSNGIDRAAANRLKESADESILKDKNIGFEVVFSKRSIIPVKNANTADYSAYINCSGFSEKTLISSKEVKEIRVPLFYCNFDVPFALFNRDKMEKFSSYKTFGKYFNSHYEIFIIPVSMSNQGITADIYIKYNKLNLEDDFNRWTPFFKRIEIPIKGGVRIDLPKENWTANFTRSGEQYDIYGYSDYEKFIDETLYISLKNN